MKKQENCLNVLNAICSIIRRENVARKAMIEKWKKEPKYSTRAYTNAEYAEDHMLY
jgi:hypothetical protein